METQIRQQLAEASLRVLDRIDCFAEIDSTNEYLLQRSTPGAGTFRVCIAARQSKGRGQRGRRWQSPQGSGIYLSVGHTFATQPEDLPSLSIVVGVAVAQALQAMGCTGIALKWPNDIVAGRGKAGGILCEVYPGKAGSQSVVAGIGLNVDLTRAAAGTSFSSSIGSISDLRSCCKSLPTHAVIVARVLDEVFGAMQRYAGVGVEPFIKAWRVFDWLRGQLVSVDVNGEMVSGEAAGIGSNGALLVRTGSEVRNIRSGSVHISA